MAAIAMKTHAAPRAGAKANKEAKRTRPKNRATKKANMSNPPGYHYAWSQPKKRAANAPEGGGGAKARKSRRSRLDSDGGKKSPIAAAESSTNASPHVGSIYMGERTIATIQAPTQEDYDKAKELIEAGFRAQGEAVSWGMKPEDYWQLHQFPADHDDWKARMERLASHSLHDDDASHMQNLMHCCTWTLEPLWKWMHHLAEHAKNPNVKRDAGTALGELYYEARQKKNRKRLGEANEEFARRVAPFDGIKKKPSEQLTRWVSNRMRHCMDLWKMAIEVATRFENMKTQERRHPFARMKVVDGVHYFEQLPMNTMAEAWDAYFIQEHSEHPSGAWNELLNELEAHPFCTKRLTLAQLTDFEFSWSAALESVLRQQWATRSDEDRKKIGGDQSFEHRIGTAKDPRAGYWVAKDFFVRFWVNKQTNDAAFWKSFNTRTPGTAVDPVAKRVLAMANRRKSRGG